MLEITIKNLKSIKSLDLKLPLDTGLYAFTGNNGSGKSTILNVIAKTVYSSALDNHFSGSNLYNGAEVIYKYNNQTWHWKKNNTWKQETPNNKYLKLKGTYESSLIFGNRFSDAHKSSLAKYYRMKAVENDFIESSEFVKENLGIILRNNPEYYKTLKKLSLKKSKELEFSSTPYLYVKDNTIIQQIRMSTGEYLLVSLLDYIEEKCIKNRNIEEPLLLLIDEVEIALHPEAQSRLMEFLRKLVVDSKVTVYFSTHSPTIISEIHPTNIFNLEVLYEKIYITNPCYPAYVIKNLAQKAGCDFLFLVEDELAAKLVDSCLKKISGRTSRMINIVPTGDWRQTLKNHNNFKKWKLFPNYTQIYSILDGDVKEEVKSHSKKDPEINILKKHFLPIESLEKFLYKEMILEPNIEFIKYISDNYYENNNFYDVLESYKKIDNSKEAWKGKNLLETMIKNYDGVPNDLKENIANYIVMYCYDFEDLIQTLSDVLSCATVKK